MCVPRLLGLEGPIADELKRLDIPEVTSENGRVYFSGGDAELARANICLRIGERVLIEVGSFEAKTFDALFEGTKALPWEAHPRGRRVSRQGPQSEQQAFLRQRLPEDHQEGRGGAAEGRVRTGVVPGGPARSIRSSSPS